MPIFRQGYRSYDGEVKERFRWWVIVKQELRVLIRTRSFIYPLILAVLHICFRVLMVVTYDILMSNPTHPLTAALRNFSMISVDGKFFFDFIRMQSPLVFLVAVFAGAGMICDDFRHNLMDIYFSKPLTVRDYLLGKLMTLVVVGLAITAVPGIFLVVLHNLLVPSLEVLQSTYWLLISIPLYSLVVAVPCALGVLACSALFKSPKYASMAVIAVVFVDFMISASLSRTLHNTNFLVLSIPMAMNRIGDFLFAQRRPSFDLDWGWAVLFILALSGLALWIVTSRVRKAQVAT